MRLDQRLTLTHGNSVYWSAFSPAGDRLATASLDNTVKVWSLPDGQHVHTLKGHGDGVTFVEFLADARIVTAGLDQRLMIWPPDGEKPTTTILASHPTYLSCAAVGGQGRLLASGGFDLTVKLWETESGNALGVLMGHEAVVQCVAISESGELLASGGDDLSVRLWDVNKRALIKSLAGHSRAVEGLAFAADDTLLASAGADGVVRLWTPDGAAVAQLESPETRCKCVAFSPDGKWLATGATDGAVRIWDHAAGQCVLTQPAHRNTVYGVTFSADGRQFASSGFDRTILVWDFVAG